MRLLQPPDKTDVAAKLISDGLLRTDIKEEKRAHKLVRNSCSTSGYCEEMEHVHIVHHETASQHTFRLLACV